MSALDASPTARPRWPVLALCAAMPVLGAGYQIAAKTTALGLAHTRFGLAWLATLVTLPSAAALLALELVSFAVWMTVLAAMKLSTAFPMTAVGYVLVVATGWIVFHESVAPLQVCGGVCILGGIWLLGREERDAT